MNVTIPVYNEAERLPRSLPRLHRFLCENWRFEFEVVIADNGSTDGTSDLAADLAREHRQVRVLRLEDPGRGRALKRAWRESGADVLSYMDVDLSTDLAAFGPLIKPLAEGGFDMAIGSRLLPGSVTTRGWKRDLISRCYNRLIKVAFRTRFADAQCGFKAITRSAAAALLPLVEDDAWFFDTELLILAETLGYRVFEFPVRWVDDSDSHVRIWKTAIEDIKGLLRVRRSLTRKTYLARSRRQVPPAVGQRAVVGDQTERNAGGPTGGKP
ncbi:MAG: glycosyltransferase family 2 protein [Verrucomicrobia bacterium]|nr:glycosyltransferase family 2 protein [Verrucomicrobiota bacterium]